MTTTTQATSLGVMEWSKIFPRQVTENLTSSVTFMKQLTVVALSTITYLKDAFPNENYMVETFHGMQIMTLKNKCKDELAQFLSTALTQAFDAFDKKYLHQLALCFYDGDGKLENLIEYHIFEYTYSEGDVSMSISSKGRGMKSAVRCKMDAVRLQTAHLIRACIVMLQTCPTQLPESYEVSLRLYYNEDAPEGYQAPGYLSAEDTEDPLPYTYEEALKLGQVETPFHKLTVRTYVKDSLRASHEAIASQNPPKMTQAQNDLSGIASSERNQSGPQLKCACNNYECDDVPNALLTCSFCNTLQHAACYGVTEQHAAQVTHHCCASCADIDSRRVPTDNILAELADRKRESVAIFRRALEWCQHVSTLAAIDLCQKFGLSQVSAVKLMKLLDFEGIIRQEPHPNVTTPAIIIPDKLKAVRRRYFHTPEEDIVDRLVAQTLASQSSQSDPVGDVLDPVEKANLQNASQLGRVIDNPEINNNIEDSTLKQYREALKSLNSDHNIDEDLPLSGDPIEDMKKMEKKSGKRKTNDDKKMNSGIKTKKAKFKRV